MNSHDLKHEKLCYEPPDQPDDNWYVKNKNAAQTEGYSYQVKLSMLLLLNGKELVQKEQISRFYLATDLKEATGFANIVFKCEGTRGSKIIFLQTKHKEKEAQVTKDLLLSGNIFNLNSFFRNYIAIRKYFSSKKKDVIFGENYSDVDCTFIIFTNVLPQFGDEKDINKITVDQDDMMNFGEVNYYYGLGPSDEIEGSILKKHDTPQKEELREFLDTLKLFLGQPNEHQLGEIIKQKIQSMFSVEENLVEIVFAGAQSKIQEWFGSKGKSHFLTNKNRFFEDAARVSIKFDVKEPVSLFSGRNRELESLHKILQNAGEAVISQTASVTGIGGVGKTELARKYISEHSKEYDDNVIWINAENYVTATESFIRVAEEKLGINTLAENGKRRETQILVQEIYDYFARMHRKSLFIFDNSGRYKAIGDTDEGIDKFLPSGPNKPYVLITSRDQKWGNIKTLALDVFTDEEAAEFIRKALKNTVEVKESEVKKLAEELQYLPLALSQAVAYIIMENIEVSRSDKNRFTVSNYLELFKANTRDLLCNRGSGEVLDDYSGTVMTTWETTMAKIREKKLQGGEEAVNVLNIIAYLASDKIPVDIIFEALINDEQLRHSAVELLDKYCMVNLKGGKVNVHRLVQQVTRIKLEEEGKNEEIVQKTFELIQKSFPYRSDKLNDISRKKLLLPHSEVLLSHVSHLTKENFEHAQKIESNIFLHLPTLMADGYSDLGDPKRQKELLEEAFPFFEKLYGSNHFEITRTLVNIGHAYGDLGRQDEKKKLLQRALKILEDHYGPNHFEVARTLVSLGDAFRSLGDPKKQEELLNRALKIEEDHYGSNHVQVAATLTSLSNAHHDLGDLKKQKELLERALKIQEDYYEPNHFHVASTLVNLGNVHRSFGDMKKQIELQERALKIEEGHYGPNHFEVAKTLINLGSAYSYLGNHKKRKELGERALKILENHYGPNHFEVAAALENLGSAHNILGDPYQYKQLLERALEIEEDYYGPNHFQVAETLVSLGDAYRVLGDPYTQKQLLERALKIKEDHYGPNHFEVSLILVHLANAYGDLGDHKKRKELLKRAIKTQEDYFGPNHIHVAETLVSLGSANGVLGDFYKQKEMQERALKVYENYYGPNHLYVAQSLVNLGKAYGDLGYHKKRRKVCERALKIEEDHFGPNYFEVATTLVSLGNAHGDLGDAFKKKDLLERALKIEEDYYGPNHFQVAATLVNLGNAHESLGDPKKQIELQERALKIQEDHFGPNHLEVGWTLFSLGFANGALNDQKKEKELLERALPILEGHFDKGFVANLRCYLKDLSLDCAAVKSDFALGSEVIYGQEDILPKDYPCALLQKAISDGNEDDVTQILYDVELICAAEYKEIESCNISLSHIEKEVALHWACAIFRTQRLQKFKKKLVYPKT